MIKDHNLQMGDVQEFITFCLLNCANYLCDFLIDLLQKRKNILKLIYVLNYFNQIFLNMYTLKNLIEKHL